MPDNVGISCLAAPGIGGVHGILVLVDINLYSTPF